MQKISNIFKNTALAIIAAVLAAGCMFEKMDMPKDLQNVLVQINVSPDEMLTKATPDASESTINTLHVYAFNGDVFAGYYQRQATAAEDFFLMDLVLPESGIHNVDFYLVANAASMLDRNVPVVMNDQMTREELEAIRYTGLAKGAPLPLYCKQTEAINVDAVTENTSSGHVGHILLTQQVSFKLSRNLAKLSVYGAKPAEASTSPQILSVTMLAAGTREFSYLYPQTADILNSVNPRLNDKVILAEGSRVQLSALTGDGSSADHYTPVSSSDVYLAEVAVGGTAEGWAVMTSEKQVTLKVEYSLNPEGAVKTAFIYMPPIVRNTHYKVCILVSEEEEGKIYVTYEVADWENHEMPGFTFTYPSHSYIRHDVPVSADDESKPSSSATMSETSPFTGYFQMLAPDNDEWMPTLVGSNASDADVKIYDYETGTEVPASEWPIAASSKWYKVVVIPHNDFIQGNTVDLAITYQPDLVTASEYLLINGSSGNYFWPGSTDENFVTITMVN